MWQSLLSERRDTIKAYFEPNANESFHFEAKPRGKVPSATPFLRRLYSNVQISLKSNDFTVSPRWPSSPSPGAALALFSFRSPW
jgi:hypothetical protein